MALYKPFKSIVLLGPPGSGKGTLGKFLGSKKEFFHLSSGEIFRNLPPHTKEGKLYQEYAAKGELIPDNQTIYIWHAYVCNLIEKKQFCPEKQILVLDGIPRNKKQVELISSYIEVCAILVLQVSDIKLLAQRICKRALVEKREDDADSAIFSRRMHVYKEQTEELLQCYPSSKIHPLDATAPPESIQNQSLQLLSCVL